MSTWTTKSLDRPREYIIIRHTIPGVNYSVNGVKFRNSYAVVEKDSKTYFQLKKIPVLKNAKEYPLSELRKLAFITRTADILLIYGRDVYNEYLKALAPIVEQEIEAAEEQEKQEHIEAGGCRFIRADGSICSHASYEYSPSSFCTIHVVEDPLLEQLGIKKPKYMTKQEKYAFKEKVIKTLENNKKKIIALKTTESETKVETNGDQID